MTPMEEAKQLTQQAIDKGGPSQAQPWARKWYFEWFYGTVHNPTVIRSGCCGAETRDEAETMIRKHCWAENASSSRLRIKQTPLKWPRLVS